MRLSARTPKRSNAGRRGGVVVVSHDRAFLADVASSVVELSLHDGGATLYGGGWSAYEREREVARRNAFEDYERATAERARVHAAANEHRRRAAVSAGHARTAARDGDKHAASGSSRAPMACGPEPRGSPIARRWSKSPRSPATTRGSASSSARRSAAGAGSSPSRVRSSGAANGDSDRSTWRSRMAIGCCYVGRTGPASPRCSGRWPARSS